MILGVDENDITLVDCAIPRCARDTWKINPDIVYTCMCIYFIIWYSKLRRILLAKGFPSPTYSFHTLVADGSRVAHATRPSYWRQGGNVNEGSFALLPLFFGEFPLKNDRSYKTNAKFSDPVMRKNKRLAFTKPLNTCLKIRILSRIQYRYPSWRLFTPFNDRALPSQTNFHKIEYFVISLYGKDEYETCSTIALPRIEEN